MKWLQDLLDAVPAEFQLRPLEPTLPGNRVLGPMGDEVRTLFRAVEYHLGAMDADATAHGALHDDPAHTAEDCAAFQRDLAPRFKRVKLLERVLLAELDAQFGGQLQPDERLAATADGIVAVSEVPAFIRELAEALGTSPKVVRAPGMLAIALEGSIPADAPPEKRTGFFGKLFGG